ncbi:MAG: hypothetical protein FVV1_gp1 [Fushun virga-like virus 1]|nr:MAG: hypothetical protein FVV1_gp1 [Fushun virga-like virus 1]
MEPGFCYLVLFREEHRTLARNKLFAFPLMKNVLRLLYVFDYGVDVRYPLPYLVNHNMLHVDDDEKILTLPELLKLYFDTTYKIGFGYCYKLWFKQLAFDDIVCEHLCASLGYMPKFCDVLKEIIYRTETLDVLVSKPVLVHQSHIRVFHVAEGQEYITLFHLLFMPNACDRVGVDNMNVSQAMNAMGIDCNDVYKKVFNMALMDKTSPYHTALLDEVVNRISNSNSHAERIVIKYHLSDQQRLTLQHHYPEFKIEHSTKPQAHPHANAAAMRALELQKALTMLNYRSGKTTKGYISQVKDIGGNAVTHMQRGRLDIHSCMPILDHRDNLRRSNTLYSMRDLINQADITPRQQQKYQMFMNDETLQRRIFCNRKGQNCPISAPSVVFCHSTYDMTTRDIADSMDEAQATVGIALFIYDASMMTSNRGTLAHLNMEWRKDISKDMIYFDFVGDSSYGYQHKFSTYVSLIMTTCIVSSRNTMYYSEVVDVRMGTMFVKLVRGAYCVPTGSVMRRCLWFEYKEPMTVVQYYDYLYEGAAHDRNIKYVRRDICAPTKLWEKIVGYYLGLPSNKMTIAAGFDYGRSVNVATIVNGVSVSTHTMMQINDLYDLCAAGFAYCFAKRFATTQLAKAIADAEIEHRELCDKGWVAVIADRLKHVFDKEDVDHSSPIDNVRHLPMKDVGFCTRIFYAVRRRKKFNVTFSDAISRVEVTQYVPPYAFTTLTKSFPREWLSTRDEYEETVPDRETIKEIVKDLISTGKEEQEACNAGGYVCGIDGHVCQRRPIYAERICDAKLSIVQVPGDGQCLYHALIKLLDLSVSVQDFKKLLLTSKALEGFCNESAIRKVLSDDKAWGTLNEVAFTSTLFNVRICLHGEAQMTVSPQSVHEKTIHLNYAQSHYSPMIEVQEVKPETCEKTLREFVPPEFCDIISKYYRLRDLADFSQLCGFTYRSASGTVGEARGVVVERDGDCASYVVGDENVLFWNFLENYVYVKVATMREKKWDAYRNIADVGLYLNRSAYKLVQILDKYGLQVRGKTILDVAGAPGGFVQVCEKRAAKTIVTFSRPHAIQYSQQIKTRPIYASLDEFTTHMRFDVVLGDAGDEDSYGLVKSDLLFRSQLLMLTNLKKGGFAILKHCNVFSLIVNWNKCNSLMFRRFQNIDVYKPSVSRPGNSEVYVIMRNYDVSKSYQHRVPSLCDFLRGLRVMCASVFENIHVEALSVSKMRGEFEAAVAHRSDWIAGAVDKNALEQMMNEMILRSRSVSRSSSVSSFDFGEMVFERSEDLERKQEEPIHHDDVNEKTSIPELSIVPEEESEDCVSESPSCPAFKQDEQSKSIYALSEDSVSVVSKSDTHATGLTKNMHDLLEEIETGQVILLPTNDDIWSMCDASESETVGEEQRTPEAVKETTNEEQKTPDVCLATTSYCDNNYHSVIVMDVKRGLMKDRPRTHELLCCVFKGNDQYQYLQGMHEVAGMVVYAFDDKDAQEANFRYIMTRVYPEFMFETAVSTDCLDTRAIGNVFRTLSRGVAPGEDAIVSWSMRFKVTMFSQLFTAQNRKTVRDFMQTVIEQHDTIFVYMTALLMVGFEKENAAALKADESLYLDSMKIEEYLQKVDVIRLLADCKNAQRKYPPEKYFREKPKFIASIKAMLKPKQVAAQQLGPITNNVTSATIGTALKSSTYLKSSQSVSQKIVGIKMYSAKVKPAVPDVHDMRLLAGKSKFVGPYDAAGVSQIGKLEKSKPVVPVKISETDRHYLCDIKSDSFDPISPKFYVFDNQIMIKDLLVALVNVRDIKSSVERYSWCEDMRRVDAESIARKVQVCVDTELLSRGLFTIVDLNMSAVKLLIAVPTTPENARRDYVRFVNEFMDVYPTYKNVVLLEPEVSLFLGTETVARLTREILTVAHKHRYQCIVANMVDCHHSINKTEQINKSADKLTEASILMHDNWVSKGVVDYKYKYAPKRYDNNCMDNRLRNAVAEVVELWRVSGAIVLNNLRQKYYSVGTITPAKYNAVKQSLQCSAEGFGLMNRDGSWYVKPGECKTEYEYAFDGQAMVKVRDLLEGKVRPSNDLLLVSDDTVLMQDEKLYAGAKKVVENLDAQLPQYNLTLVSGVPGCGKTTEAIKNFTIGDGTVDGDLILFPTRNSCLDFRERVNKKRTQDGKPLLTERQLKDHIKTVDSFVINDVSKSKRYGKLLVDEALMLHAGQIIVAAIKAGVTDVYMIGDIKQIPYVNRTALDVRYSKIDLIVKPSKLLEISYRCTLSTAVALSPLYCSGTNKCIGMYSVNDRYREMEIKRIASIDSVHIDDRIQYLTYLQSEKMALQKRGAKHVNTIHEFQGKEADDIVLVRGSSKMIDIYDKEAYNLVAISRHKKTFTYYTMATAKDTMAKWINNVNALDRGSMSKFFCDKKR